MELGGRCRRYDFVHTMFCCITVFFLISDLYILYFSKICLHVRNKKIIIIKYYFQTKDMMKAASAAFTYLVMHPDDKVMQSNLRHYSKLDGVEMSEIINYEAKVSIFSKCLTSFTPNLHTNKNFHCS